MTKTTKTVVASSVVAATIATGVYFATPDKDNTIDWDSIVPNIEEYMPVIPDTGEYALFPKIDPLFEQTLPNDYLLQTSAIGTVEGQQIQIESLFPINNADVCDLEFEKNAKKNEKIQAYFSDKRNILYDYKIFSNKYLNDWFVIYENYKNNKFETIPLKNSFRMISEVKLPKNQEQLNILNENLAYYKSRRYDSVLVTFDGNEDSEQLSYLVQYIKSKGFRVFFAYSGEESHNQSVFIDPQLLKNQLSALAKYSEGFLIAWRRTSVHLFKQDVQYMNYVIECVRNANKNCLIFGEVYYGNTSKYSEEGKYGLGTNLPDCASATTICNFGTSYIKAEAVVKHLIPNAIGKKIEQIPVIIGQRAYYLTTNRNNLSQEDNQRIKERIERRFKKAGCKGTITLHGDGRDDIKKYDYSNNLSEIIYSKLK